MSTGKIIAAAAILLVGIPVGCSYINAVNKAATAPARVASKTLETDNIIFNYERFFDQNKNFVARVAQIKEQASYLEAETDPAEKSMLRTEVSAMRQSCRELAASYNADSQKLNRNLFKSNSLPAALDANECE